MSHTLSRRKLIKLLVGLGLGTSHLAQYARSDEPLTPQRLPNLLFFLTDDQAWNTVGSSNQYPFLKTPHIDRLVHEGAQFTNSFVTTSLCSPNRATLLTGCYAHRHGVQLNETTDPKEDLLTFPQVLRRLGYDTAFIGKWHMALSAEPRPGFDYWLSFKGQGEYVDPSLNINGREFRQQGYITDILTEYALRWLNKDREKPFCLILSHKAIHGPFTPAPRHKDAFMDVELAKPPNYDDTFEDKPVWQRQLVQNKQRRRERWASCLNMGVPEELAPTPWNPKDSRILDYFRCLLGVDESLGEVLSTLEGSGILDDTLVVFTSDNGFSLGAHRRRTEKMSMYEESIRVPLVIRYPKLVPSPMTVPQIVTSVDIAPTLLNIVGAQIPASMQGRSILPLLLPDRKANWNHPLFYQYFYDKNTAPCYPTMLGIRTEKWKYIFYPDVSEGINEELYDLTEDPHEHTNLAINQKYSEVLNQLRGELNRFKKETGYTGLAEEPIENFFWNLKLLGEESNFLPRTIKSLYNRFFEQLL